jgi:hypothetical protein
MHRFGVLRDGRWALLVVRDLHYVFAFESKGPVKRDHSRTEGKLRFANPPEPLSAEAGEQLLRLMFATVTDADLPSLQERAYELKRRYVEFDLDIERHLRQRQQASKSSFF